MLAYKLTEKAVPINVQIRHQVMSDASCACMHTTSNADDELKIARLCSTSLKIDGCVVADDLST